MAWIRFDKNGCLIDIHVQPGARKNEIVGLHNDRLKIKIKSPPVDGKANECLVEYLADALSLSRSSVELVKGDASRQKQVRVYGLTPDQAEALLLKRTTA